MGGREPPRPNTSGRPRRGPAPTVPDADSGRVAPCGQLILRTTRNWVDTASELLYNGIYADAATGLADPNDRARSPEPGLAASLAILAGPWILAFVFAAAGIAKALNPEPIGETMGLLFGGLLGPWVASGGAIAALVLAEVLLAAWLISGWRPRLALVATIAALLAFTASLFALLIVEPTSPCGCGLPAISGNTAVDNGLGIARNLILVIIAVVAWPPRGSVGAVGAHQKEIRP